MSLTFFALPYHVKSTMEMLQYIQILQYIFQQCIIIRYNVSNYNAFVGIYTVTSLTAWNIDKFKTKY